MGTAWIRRVGIGAALALAWAFGSAGGAEAQTGWELGVRGGLLRTSLAHDPSPLGEGLMDVKARTRATAAAFLRLGRDDGPGLRLEVGYAPRRGVSLEGDGAEVRLDISYLEIPVLVGVRLGDGPVRIEPFAGAWWAREVGCHLGYDAPGTSLEFDCDEQPDGPLTRRTVDWGAAAGAELTFELGDALRALVDLRYTHGLHNMDASDDVSNQNVRFRGLAATAGVSWRPSS